ncbi:hypothetical protein BC826DRAFT_258610 [Russula brevipes]|nr:hypothetical protein BC826DRAFT_258610 [Russula brevipes]
MERGRKTKKNFRTLIRRDALFGPSSVSLKHGQTPREQTMMAQLGGRSVKTSHIGLRHGPLSFRQRPSATTRLKGPFFYPPLSELHRTRAQKPPSPSMVSLSHRAIRPGAVFCTLRPTRRRSIQYSTVHASTSTVVLSRSRTKPLGSIPMNKAPFFWFVACISRKDVAEPDGRGEIAKRVPHPRAARRERRSFDFTFLENGIGGCRIASIPSPSFGHGPEWRRRR